MLSYFDKECSGENDMRLEDWLMVRFHSHGLPKCCVWWLVGCLGLLAFLCQSPRLVRSQGDGDSAFSVTGEAGFAVPGQEVDFNLRLLNVSDSYTATGVISYTLPAGFSYVPGSTQVSVGGWAISHTEPVSTNGILSWGPFPLPATGHTAHNPYGVHTFVQDMCYTEFIDLQLDQALNLVGSGGYVTQLFYRITTETTAPDACAVYFVNGAYDRNLVPILRLQGNFSSVGFWERPDPGPNGDYAEIAAAFARYVDGIPRRNTHPLYVSIWNEPDLWIEWSGTPNATEYGRFFVAVSRAIRDLGDPRVRILNAAVTPANVSFIQQLMAVPGFADAFDVWASHCYPYNHPPWYNIHESTAAYGNATIDCYIEERDAIALYGGRTGFKFIIKETGHGLGDDVYAFEGYPPITESRRANYMSNAFDTYWRNWPEVIAATPFELGDPWGGWDWLDWIDYTTSLDPFQFSFSPYLQYNEVSLLDKPRGTPIPRGFQVDFKARVADDVTPGRYASVVRGCVDIAAGSFSRNVSVLVVSHIERRYLPLVTKDDAGGVWYNGLAGVTGNKPPRPVLQGELNGTPVPAGGEIVPSHFLSGKEVVSQADSGQAWQSVSIPLDASPRLLMLDGDDPGRLYAVLSDDSLVVIDVNTLQIEKRIPLDAPALSLVAGPTPGSLYTVLESGRIILIDTLVAQVTAQTESLVSPWALVFDAATHSVLVADSGEIAVVRLSQDLSTRLAAYTLDDPAGQLLLDKATRRLYVTLPGKRQIRLLDADSLQDVAQTELVGGPIVTAALDSGQDRLYVLNALSFEYRGISVLEGQDLSRLALVAGTLTYPLGRATHMSTMEDGRLLVAEEDNLYVIPAGDFGEVETVQLVKPAQRGELAADPVSGRIFQAGPSEIWVYETPSIH